MNSSMTDFSFGSSLLSFLGELENYHITTVSALLMSFISLLAHTGVFQRIKSRCTRRVLVNPVNEEEGEGEEQVPLESGQELIPMKKLIIPPQSPPRKKKKRAHPRAKKHQFMIEEDEDEDEEEIDLEEQLVVQKGSV